MNRAILTQISTTLVSARTRTMSKKVKRVLLVGRVVRKKLTRATQQKLETVKESRQRSNFTADIFFCSEVASLPALLLLLQSLFSTKELS